MINRYGVVSYVNMQPQKSVQCVVGCLRLYPQSLLRVCVFPLLHVWRGHFGKKV